MQPRPQPVTPATTPQPPQPAISLQGVSKRYPLRRGESLAALEGIDLDVARGEFVALIGPSGCGKSTLLRLVGALERPRRGACWWTAKARTP
jgi:NitT/TauT family transport system ATP-binding protein